MVSEKAQSIIEKRYLMEDKETIWAELSQRVGHGVGNDTYGDLYADCINNMQFIPGGRILRNVGRIRGSLFNCYSLPIGDSREEIGDLFKNALILWGEGGGVGINFCVDPSTKILKSDLTWDNASLIKIGDELIGFDEDINTLSIQQAKYKRTKVENISFIDRPRYEIITDRGSILVSAEHPFVAKDFNSPSKKKGQGFHWKTADTLSVGDQIQFTIEPWETQYSYKDGWLAGIFDGEGCISKTNTTKPTLSIGQNKGDVYNKIRDILDANKCKYNVYKNSSNACYQFRLAGKWEAIRFIGMFPSTKGKLLGHKLWENKLIHDKLPNAIIESIKYLGNGPVIGIQTSERTLITNGFLSHNSTLRPIGAPIKGVGGTSSGLVSFMRAVDGIAATVESGGQRRAASLGLCEVWHPEIMRFINAKQKEGDISYFNISVGINESFIDAVRQNAPWNLSFNQLVSGTIESRYIWNEIIEGMVHNGEPGLINMSNLSKNNSYYFAPVRGTNPCVTGDTLVQTTIGDLPIKELTKYKSVDVYTRTDSGYLTIKPARFFRTKTKARCITVHTTRGSIKCTPDHKFITEVGDIKAEDLIPNQQLIGIKRRKRNGTHVEVGCSGSQYVHEEKLVAGYYYDICDLDIHHLDGNSHNNTIQNLQPLPHGIHSILSNKGHKQWNKTNEKGQFVSKPKLKTKPNKPLNSNNRRWKILSVDTTVFHEPVFDGQVADTNKYFANGILVHNCGETCLEDYGVCNLGSIVLTKFVANGRVQWKKLEDTIRLSVRFLDRCIDINKYALAEVKRTALRGRRIGIGVMGLADMLFDVKLRYGSRDAIDFIERLFKFIRNIAYEESCKLAQEQGAFPAFDSNLYCKAKFIRSLPPSLRQDIRKYGTRNVTLMAIAPTGTISLVPEVTPSIEPLMYKAYERKDRISTRRYVHALALDESGNHRNDDWYVDSEDLLPKDHIETQVAIQKYTDGAVSKTIIVPNDYKSEQLSEILLESIDDLKGVTVYRTGSRENQIITSITDYDNAVSTMDEGDVLCATGKCDL